MDCNATIREVTTSDSTVYSLFLPDHDSDHIQKQIAASGRPYEEPLLESILARSKAGDLILDIGANIGNHTLFLAHHGRSVMAFEPNKKLVKVIEESIRLNGYEDRVKIFNVAIGAKAGHGAMDLPEAGNLGMGRVTEGPGDVEIVTLEACGIDRPIKAIKIDVEGMEDAVLQGARSVIRAHRPDLYIEIAEKGDLAAILNAGHFEGYFYVDTFNHTPTHLFVHESRFAPDITSMPLADETIFAIAGLKKEFLSLHERNRHLVTELKETAKLLDEAMEKGSSLQAEVAYLEKRLRKYHTRYKKTLTWGLILGAPMIVLLSPVIVAVAAVNFLKRKKRRKRRAAPTPAASKRIAAPTRKKGTTSCPAALDARFGTPLKALPQADPDQPLVSIIIPTFNREDFLARAIRSVQAQSHTNLEVIIVDDGSTDSSVAVATGIAQEDPRVTVVSTLRNFGCFYARNVGVMHAKGRYIGICDSDDILAPYRIERQVAEMQANPEILACFGKLRRWSEDFTQPLTDLRYGENSLLWDRSLLEDIGWYDTCRFGADSEFRERIIARHGQNTIAKIPDELYFLRGTEGSLTLSDEAPAYTLNEGKLEKRLSPKRLVYQTNFQAWHAALLASEQIPFPQRARHFALGSPEQNASPSLGQRCVGAMASFPKRRESLRLTLQTVLPQLDELILYLNDYKELPDFCDHPKLRVILGKDALGDLRDNGKFYDLPKDDDSYLFTFDDDILYPQDYVRRMIHHIEVFDRKVVVGVHGVIFPEGSFSDLGQRTVYGFRHRHLGAFVDLLGTGTTAWHSSLMQPALDDFQSKGVCDLWFARLAASSGVPLFNVPRENGWLQPIEGNDESLFAEARQRPQGFFEVYEEHLAPLLKTSRPRDKAVMRLQQSHSPEAIDAAMGQFWLR